MPARLKSSPTSTRLYQSQLHKGGTPIPRMRQRSQEEQERALGEAPTGNSDHDKASAQGASGRLSPADERTLPAWTSDRHKRLQRAQHGPSATQSRPMRNSANTSSPCSNA